MDEVRIRHTMKYLYVGCYYAKELELVRESFRRAGIRTMCEFAGTTPAKRYLYYMYIQHGQTAKGYI